MFGDRTVRRAKSVENCFAGEPWIDANQQSAPGSAAAYHGAGELATMRAGIHSGASTVRLPIVHAGRENWRAGALIVLCIAR
jgi:hypothetical protein